MADLRTIVLADDLSLVRDGIAMLCESVPGYRVAGHAADGSSALRLIESLRPDLAVLDLNLPELFTLEVIKKARQSCVATKSIVLSTRRDRKTVLEVLRGGASGYVLKSGPSGQLADAFEQVLDGGIYVSPLLEMDKIFVPQQQASNPGDPLEALSAREYQVFSLLVDGVRAKEIAARLELSPKTVDTYRASLMRKLDIHDVAGLVKFAIHRDLAAASGR